MSETSNEVVAKGSSFVGLLKALDELKGPEARERVLAALPEHIATPLRFGQVVPVGWYPVSWYAELHQAVDGCFHQGAVLARKLSHHSTLADISSMHRFIASMLSVETVFGQMHRVLGLYWKGGTVERVEIAAGRARVRFEGWEGFTPLIWEDLMGGMEAVLETCGAKHGRVKPNGRLEGAQTIEIEARWT